MKKSIACLLFIFLLRGDKIMEFYKNIKRIENPESILVLVNKNNKLDSTYIPKDLQKISIHYANEEKYLRKEAKEAFEKMSEDAKKKGYRIVAVSTYRSYEYQKNLYEKYVKNKGLEYADLCSARKGHSEHQTGLAVDVEGENKNYDFFEETKEFNWMNENAHLYGFILRYPKNKTNITGFKFEPWHYRYVGKEIATKIKKKKITLEEYLKNPF